MPKTKSYDLYMAYYEAGFFAGVPPRYHLEIMYDDLISKAIRGEIVPLHGHVFGNPYGIMWVRNTATGWQEAADLGYSEDDMIGSIFDVILLAKMDRLQASAKWN